MDEATTITVTLSIINSNPYPITLWIEPQGMPLPMEPGKRLRLVASSDTQYPPCPEIESDDDKIVYWGWVGSIVIVFDGDTEIY